LVQCRAAVLRAGHAPVDKIDRAPAARRAFRKVGLMAAP
jgi:hypothetical protein